jgi:hypothetical protein
MPLAPSTSTDQLVEGSSLPSVIEGVITRVVCAPLDFGSLFTGKWKEDRWLPFDLGAYIHVTPDEGDPLIVPIKMTSFGGLQWYIAATPNVAHDSNSSDIEYPGNPVAPDGLDMDAMTEALEDLWNSAGVKGDVKLYHQALMDTYGGEHSFSIGREVGLPKRTDWEFFLTQAEKITAWKEAIAARDTPPMNPHQLLKGFRGALERIEVPSFGKASAMKDGGNKRAWKVHVPTEFKEYVDVSKVGVASKSKSAKVASKSTTTTGDDTHAAAFTDALIDALALSDDGTLDATGIRTVALSFPKDDKELRKFAIKHRADDEFLSDIDGAEWDGDNLTLA